jgi:5'-nucleotidase
VRALVTNDDGFESPGLVVLAQAAGAAGFEVVVAAPHTESSGTSAGLTVLAEPGRSVAEETTHPELPGVTCYTVAAHPAFIVLAALDGVFGDPPDVVLSGVNRGVNIGRAVVHSGTVGAALTAGVNKLRALAASLEVADRDSTPRWETAAAVLPTALDTLQQAPEGAVLNVNVPNLPPEQLGELTRATLSSSGAVQSRLERTDESAEPSEVVTTIVGDQAEPGTDAYVLAQGTPTITPIRAVSEAADVQLPERIVVSGRQ